MAKYYTREELHQKWDEEIRKKRPIILCGAGTGISGKFAEKAGADMIGIYNSGKYRMDGNISIAGLLPIGNANQEVLELANRVLPIIKETPMIAGIYGSDPTRPMGPYLEDLKHLGFSAVMNFPTVALIDGRLRDWAEAGNMGLQQEVDALALAKEKGLFTIGYACSESDAEIVANAHLDAIICHMGLTKGGSLNKIDADDRGMEEAADFVNRLYDIAKSISPEMYVLAHGGPISSAEDTKYIYQHTKVVGFLGASSTERIPVEKPLQECVAGFKNQTILDF